MRQYAGEWLPDQVSFWMSNSLSSEKKSQLSLQQSNHQSILTEVELGLGLGLSLAKEKAIDKWWLGHHFVISVSNDAWWTLVRFFWGLLNNCAHYKLASRLVLVVDTDYCVVHLVSFKRKKIFEFYWFENHLCKIDLYCSHRSPLNVNWNRDKLLSLASHLI